MAAKKAGKKPVYAFIDSQNLNLGVRSQGWTLDFGKFRVYLQDKYKVEKAFLFIGMMQENVDLYTRLQEVGYIVVFKPVLVAKEKGIAKIKGNVDAELVLHSMIQYGNYSQAVIVSGDGDFHCLVEYLEQQKKLSKVVVPNRKYSSLLKKYASFIVNIDLMKSKLKQ